MKRQARMLRLALCPTFSNERVNYVLQDPYFVVCAYVLCIAFVHGHSIIIEMQSR